MPIWVDLASPNLDSSRAFYERLLGWQAHVVPDPAAGGYTMFLLDGKQVAALGPTQSPEQPSAWMTYVATDDADATAREVEAAGGQVIAGPFDVLDQGRMAVFIDPTGAFFSVWQPKIHRGAEIFNVPGALCWTELETRDVARSREFYTRVFGWGAETNAFGEGSYTEWKLDGRSVAGAMEMTPNVPSNVPPYWQVYFQVDDAADTVALAQELGGQALVPVTDIGFGLFAVLSDPNGAVFGVIQLKA
jgi:predicted enzyme related to lactoylglutathione lyase